MAIPEEVPQCLTSPKARYLQPRSTSPAPEDAEHEPGSLPVTGREALGALAEPGQAWGTLLLSFHFLGQAAAERAGGQCLGLLFGRRVLGVCLNSCHFLGDAEGWSGPRIKQIPCHPGAEWVNFCASLPSSLWTLAGTEHLSVAMAAVHLKGMTG